MQVRFFAQKIDDWIRSVFLFVVVSDHPGALGAPKTEQQQQPEHARADSPSRAAEIAAECDYEKGNGESQGYDKPEHLTGTEPCDGSGSGLVKIDPLQIANEVLTGSGINQPSNRREDQGCDGGADPIAVELRRSLFPGLELLCEAAGCDECRIHAAADESIDPECEKKQERPVHDVKEFGRIANARNAR